MSPATTFADAPSEDEKPSRKGKVNWRIVLLAEPKHKREKYDYPPYVFKSNVSPPALTGVANRRVLDAACPPIRRLKNNKKDYSFLGKPYGGIMDKKMADAWETVYNYYNRMKKKLLLKKGAAAGKGGKGKGKGAKGKGGKQQPVLSKEERIAKFLEWALKFALPKKGFPPEPISRGLRCKIGQIREHMLEMATAKKLHPDYRPPKVTPAVITKEMLKCVPTDRILEIAAPRPDRSFPPVRLGVSPDALTYKPSPRVLELSIPKASREKADSDLKENPFSISPGALKYVASPRIIELAKPTERD